MSKTRNIIICIDGSSCANYAFRWAIENLIKPEDHIIMLHATKDFKNLEPAIGGAGKKEWPAEAIRAYEEKVVEQAKLLTQQYTSRLATGKIKHEAIILKGDPRTIILDNIEKYQPAAIVMGSRGLGLLKRSLLGSVSDHILHQSSAPVIIVKENE